MVKREFTVRWLVQFELVVEAEDEDQAIEEAKNRLDHGENVDCFDFSRCRRIMTNMLVLLGAVQH